MISRRAGKLLLTVLSSLLLLMACGFFKMNASAAEGDVAMNKDTGTTYPSLQAAVNAASPGDALQLLDDSEEKVMISKSVTLDLNANGNHELYSEGITLSIKDGAVVTLKSGVIVSLGNQAAVSTEGIGTAFVMEDLAIVQNRYSNSSLGAIRLLGTGDSAIYGGYISTEGSGSTISVARGTLTVSGGTIRNYGEGAALTAGFTSNNDTGTISVEGGLIENTGSGPSVSIGTQGSVFNINGGEFSDDVGNGDKFTRADGKILTLGAGSYEGTYALAYPEGTVARNVNTGVIYSSLADAVSAASGGDTIQMVADHNMDGMLIIGKNITLDLNGKNVTASVAGGWNTGAVIRTSGPSGSNPVSVTIKDSAGGGTIENLAENSGYGMQVYAYSNVTIEGGTIKGGQYGIDTTHLYTLNIKNGVITGNSAGMRITGGENNINGGKISGKYRGIEANNGDDVILTINGGEISTTTTNEGYPAVWLASNGNLTVKGGVLTGGTGVRLQAHHWGSRDFIPSASIEGGVINGIKRSVSNENDIAAVDPDKFSISGGYFSDDIGNGEGFTRPKGKKLTEVTSGGYAGFYELTPVEYAIKYVLPEGAQNQSDNPESYTVDLLPLVLSDPIFGGHSFKGWYLDSDYTNAITEITEDNITADGGDLTLYAKFEEDKPDVKPDEEPDVNPTPDENAPAEPKEAFIATVKAKGNKALKVSWTKVENAAGYDIYMAKCGKSPKYSKVKTIKGNKTLAWTKKGLRRKSTYQFYVKAWSKKNGKKTYLMVTPKAHAFTSGGNRSYTNAGKVTTAKAEITLKKGKTFKIKAKVAKIKKSKKLMHKSHAVKFRYLSADKKVATVTGKGKIKAVGKGTCYVYVYAHNGVYGKINVTVK